jgi:beta-lactamase superfamily II metal-dependent hydrolase
MPQIHYLNVKNGDCSYIKHFDERITVIDVNNAYLSTREKRLEEQQLLKSFILEKARGNFNQKNNPVNPIEYLKSHNISSVFRMILTHPDMDHMDGIEDFFKTFSPVNFWDTENTKKLADFSSGRFNESDWDFYKILRSGQGDGKRLTLYDGANGKYWNQSENGQGGGNGLHILAPTPDLIKLANETEDWNDSSYVILYKVSKFRILFCGDADNETWDHLLKHHTTDIQNTDLLIAPHHGRKSSCSYDFLRVVNPKITFFGNANKSSHLAHDMFAKLKLYRITNNQGNCLIADIQDGRMDIYVTHEAFAVQESGSSQYNAEVQGYYIKSIT